MVMGRPKKPPKFKEMLKEVIPVEDIFEPDELEMYNGLIDVYLQDFDMDDLTSGDMDDVMSLAMNRVLEVRLLKTSKGKPSAHLDISAAVEKIRKSSDKLRDNLSSRRKDRIDPARFKGFSIIDLAVAFEDDRKEKLIAKTKKMKKEEAAARKKRKEHVGNRYDPDVQDKKLEDE